MKKACFLFMMAFFMPGSMIPMKIVSPGYMVNTPPPKTSLCLNHRLVQLFNKQPLKSKVTFVSLPWYQFFKGKENKIDLLNISVENGFALIELEEFEWLLPYLNAMGVNTLFVVHLPQNRALKVIDGVTLVPFPDFSLNKIEPSTTKYILYSFVGSSGHPLKRKIFGTSHPKNTIILERPDIFYSENNKELVQRQEEYSNILAQSRFSLCPRGYGLNTLRFWESLQAGAIPVLISDDLALPEGFDWDSCIIRVPESEIQAIPTIIAAILPEQEIAMRSKCLEAFALFSGDHLADPMRRFFGEI